MVVHRDCRHFLGDRPCQPHKEERVHCEDCPHHDPVEERFLIVKLGAAGDVLRTTPLLRAIKAHHPHAHVTWLTRSPEVLPSKWIDRILPFTLEAITWVMSASFSHLLSLDKDPEAVAIASKVKAVNHRGFMQGPEGLCAPADALAQEKFLTGLFDDVSKAYRKSYPQEIIEMCGYAYQRERYVLELPESEPKWKLPTARPLVGLATGCGARWPHRNWPDEHWMELATRLVSEGLGVVLLGGPPEEEKNRRIARASGAFYAGHFPLPIFFSLVNQLDLVVTAVSLALHVALGLGKRVVLFNNIFSPYEFELYDQGTILAPDYNCTCYFDPVCPIGGCMKYLYPNRVMEAIEKELGR
ncbi:MAG: glycosyltransferase family 9 protein [Calditrichaeota bacterium]|nr:glycosyltransferase family 9 protein [Calditrichota bacterium]